MTEKKTSSLRPFDKREAQRKSIKEKEEEEAAERYIEVSPKIFYEGNEVHSMEIWLDFIDRNGFIYIAPFGDVSKKVCNIKLSYTIGKDINAKSSNASTGDLMADWTVHTMEKIVVRHNKLNTGIIIEKIFGVKGLGDEIVKQSIYIPMSRIYHIITDVLRIHKDEIEK
jgi:hypothetical protein